VVIAGMGLVGASLALECGRRGLRCLVADPRREVADLRRHPRCKLINVRSMMHMRRWGLAGALRDADPLPAGWPMTVRFATRLLGIGIAEFRDVFGAGTGRPDDYPERPQWIPQPLTERLLRERAAACASVVLRLGWSVQSYSDAADGGLTVTLADERGAPAAVRARFLVGCDGARSTVRECAGIGMTGSQRVIRGLGVVFWMPTVRGLAPAIQHWLVNDDAPALAGPLDGNGHWFLQAHLPHGVSPGDVGVDRLLKRVIGGDLQARVLDVTPWEAPELLADAYRRGRVLLAGDAAHLHPPYGGHGANCGIGDAVDLGWKLAATIQGWGGPALLDSYELERRSLAARVIREAVANARALGPDLLAAVDDPEARGSLEADGGRGDGARHALAEVIGREKEREFRSLGLVLGSSYERSPVIAREPGIAPAPEPCTYSPSAHPGHLAPHAWLPDGRSLFDLLSDGFTLISLERERAPVGVDQHRQAQRMVAAARAVGMPLSHVRVADERLLELYGARMALIRPDQHVCWRGDRLPARPSELLNLVRGAAANQTSAPVQEIVPRARGSARRAPTRPGAAASPRP